jgi:hypothetical protein
MMAATVNGNGGVANFLLFVRVIKNSSEKQFEQQRNPFCQSFC